MMLYNNLTYFFITLFFGGMVSAACQSMTLSNVNSAVNLNANSFPTLDIRVEKGQGSCSNFFIVMDNGGASSYANRVLQSNTIAYPIQFYKDAGRTQILKDEFETSTTETISGVFSGNVNTLNFVYYAFLNIAVNQYAQYGNYTGNFTLKLFSGDSSNRVLMDSKVVNFSFLQNKAIDISLVSSGAPFNVANTTKVLNFGTLIQDATLAVDIVMMYNAGYAVSMSSINGGRLKHATASRYVAYDVTVDGVSKALTSTPNLIKNATGISPAGGLRLPVTIRVGDVSEAAPGTYNDIISITVASYE